MSKVLMISFNIYAPDTEHMNAAVLREVLEKSTVAESAKKIFGKRDGAKNDCPRF